MISAYLSVALSREHRPALLEKGIFLRPSEEGLKEPVDKTCRIAVAYRHPYRLLAVIRLAPTKARPVFENSVLEGVRPPRVCRHFAASKHECPLSDGIIGISNGKIHALDRRSFFTKKSGFPGPAGKAFPCYNLPAKGEPQYRRLLGIKTKPLL